MDQPPDGLVRCDPNPIGVIFRREQAGNATASSSTNVDMNVVAGQDPFEYVIEGLEQASSEPAGFDVRVSALNSAGYGRPSAALNIKVTYDISGGDQLGLGAWGFDRLHYLPETIKVKYIRKMIRVWSRYEYVICGS